MSPMSGVPQRLLHDSLLAHAADPAVAGRTAVVVEGRGYTYAELLDASLRLASALQGFGVGPGDRVAVYMDNTWPCIVSIYATLLAGGVFIVVNPQTKADKLAYVLDDSGAKVLCSDGHLARELTAGVSQASSLAAVVCSGDMPETAKPVFAFDDVLAENAPLAACADVIALDLAALIYTSGSTGNPKGVMQTHQAMVFTAGSLVEYLRLNRDARILNGLPLAFDYGLYQLLMAIHLGATLILERSFTYPAQVFARMREQRATVFPGVPTVFAMLLASHQREPLCFPDVVRVTNTAAGLPDDVAQRLREVFPNALIYKMYGLTECKRVCYLEPELMDAKPGSVGKAIPGTQVFLLDEEGRPVPPGKTGILHVRGPHVMLGYWNRPDLSEKMLKSGRLPGERVLCTHDHFRMDDEGFLYFVGRTDDIIKTRAEKVSPAEVENAMHGIPGIREVAVIGVPDALLGEAVRAYVVLAEGASLNEKQVKLAAAARLENFMVPRDIVFCDDLPKTVTGKVSKKLLLEQAMQELESL